ncbi:MAG: L-threonylcarbamoyladenylate synthase, partial [Syntrophobacteraceae bacterium]
GGTPLCTGVVDKVFAVKGRGPEKPLPLIASSREAALSAVSEWPVLANVLAETFWPGPLSLLLPVSSSIPSELHRGTGKVAIRISSHPVATLLAFSAGGILISTSANRSGEPPAFRPDEISREILERVDGFLDAGILSGGLPSTIVDVALSRPRLVRAGALEWDLIARAASGAR